MIYNLAHKENFSLPNKVKCFTEHMGLIHVTFKTHVNYGIICSPIRQVPQNILEKPKIKKSYPAMGFIEKEKFNFKHQCGSLEYHPQDWHKCHWKI